MRWFFRVEYDGGSFAGWQTQNNAHSVQAELERAFGTVLRARCKVVGAGRTDAGVHAVGQGAHIDLPDGIDMKRSVVSVNAVLPREVAVRDFKRLPDTFHARFSAVRRSYKYCIVTRKSPLRCLRSWMVTYPVDWKLVAANLPSLLGRHDFRAFCASKHGARTTVCTVEEAKLQRRGDLRVLTIGADRFLYKMVRSVVGTLVDIGRGAIPDSLDSIIRSRDRKRAGETAPAWGLVLDWVTYSEV